MLFTEHHVGKGSGPIAVRVRISLLSGLGTLALCGCGLLEALGNLLPGTSTAADTQVELQVWVVGADQDALGPLDIDLNEAFLVQQAGDDSVGAPSTRESTLLVPSNLTGGTANTHVLIPRDARVGTYLPLAVPSANASKDALKQSVPPPVLARRQMRENQVMIAAKLVEVTLDKFDQLGPDFGVSIPEQNNLVPATPVEPLITVELQALYGSILDDVQRDTILAAFVNDSSSEVIQSPRIVLFNNQTGTFMVQNERGFVADLEPAIRQAVIDADPVVDYIQTGPVLDVRPVISADRRFVTLELRLGTRGVMFPLSQQFDDADGQTYSIQFPVMQRSQASTTITVPDGGTLFLGGQKTSAAAERENGLPVLSRIPLLNRVFQNEALIKDEHTLLIFITPRIIKE